MDDAAPHPMTRSLRWLVPTLLSLLTGAALMRALSGEFQQWDDVALLVENPHFRGLGGPQLRWMFTTHLMGHYMPVTWITYGLDYLVWGLDPFGFHLTNIALHAANVGLLYVVARRLLDLAWRPGVMDGAGLSVGAGFAALAFGVHPLRVESVAWITERRDVLCGFFYLLTVLLYLRYTTAEPGTRARRIAYGAAVGCFVLALLSKSMAVTLPAVLLILDTYPLRRLRLQTSREAFADAGRLLREKVPFLVATVMVSAAAFLALWSGASATSWQRLGLLERLALSAYSVAFYLGKTILPTGLSPLYALILPVHALEWRFIASAVIVLSITLIALVLRARCPALLTVWLAYLAMLTPVAGFFHNGHQIAADRYTYLPCIGWTLLAGGLVGIAWSTMRDPYAWRRRVGRAAVLVACTAVVALGVATWQQTAIWLNDETLWRQASRLDPQSPVAAGNLGAALRMRGRLAEGIEQSQRAIALRPAYAEAYFNLALAKREQGDPAAAELNLRRAIAIRPTFSRAHAALGALLDAQGRGDEALQHFQSALASDPESALAHNDLGVALARSGRLAEAIDHFSEAVRIDPNYARAQNNLGLALVNSNRLPEAATHFRAALRAQPDFADAARNLAETLRHLNRRG